MMYAIFRIAFETPKCRVEVHNGMGGERGVYGDETIVCIVFLWTVAVKLIL